MNKTQQSAYHNILQGFQNMADEILLPRMEPEELYNVFFQLRLDHPEIFWATGFRYKYYHDSPNLIFVPEYLFEKNKVKEHPVSYTHLFKKNFRGMCFTVQLSKIVLHCRLSQTALLLYHVVSCLSRTFFNFV